MNDYVSIIMLYTERNVTTHPVEAQNKNIDDEAAPSCSSTHRRVAAQLKIENVIMASFWLL